MEINWILPFSGRDFTVRSWDNNYASYLLETGVLGLLAVLILNTMILIKLYKRWRKADKGDKGLHAGIISSVIVLIFMMTNVQIFIPQLKLLFWSLVAISNLFEKEPELIIK